MRGRLTQLRAGLGKLLRVSHATAKHFVTVSAAERKERLRGQLAQSYRLKNADEILAFVKRHKCLVPSLEVIPGQIRSLLAVEPETMRGLDLEYFHDFEYAEEYLAIYVITNVDSVERVFEIKDKLFDNVLEPLDDQAADNIAIRVQYP